MIKIEKFVVNPLQENSFIVSDESGACVFVDPGFYFEEEHHEIREYISTNNLKPEKIVNTHGHFDHIMGVEFLRKEYNIPFYLHAQDVFWVERAVDQGKMFGFDMYPVKNPDALITNEVNFSFGNSEFQVFHIPGHSPGHIVLYHAETKQLIAGDVLFYGSIGRTDLPGGNHELLISGIKEKLFELPDDVQVFCGHGPETTIGFEKKTNPFLT